MAQQFSDAARSELTAGISAGDTTIALADGTRFPEANAGTSPVSDENLWFKAVLQDETGFEIVYVRTHAVATTPNTLSNVLRGQEGTTARNFAAASVIGVRLTASDMANLWATMATKADASHTHAQGDVTGLSTALAGKADDTAVVKLTGAQTVAGVKTFSDRSAHAGAYTPSAQPAHSATPTFDCATSNVFEPATLTSNVTSITLINAVPGQTVQIRFQQNAMNKYTVAVPSGAKVDGSMNMGYTRVSWLILTYSARASRWEGNWLQIPS